MRDAVIVWALMACGAVSACTAQAPGGSEPATTRVEAPPPLIGAWRSSVDVQSGVFATAKGVEFMYVFHGDRTMVESSNYDAAPPVPPAYGVWRMIPGTGLEHEAKYEFFTTAASPPDQFKTGAGWLPSPWRRDHRAHHSGAGRQELHVDDPLRAVRRHGRADRRRRNGNRRGARIDF